MGADDMSDDMAYDPWQVRPMKCYRREDGEISGM